MLSFDDQTHIYTRKTTYLHLSTLYWGGGGNYAQIVPLKITIVVANDSLVIFISLIRMRSKRDIKMGRLCTPGGAVLGIVGGGCDVPFFKW